MTVRLFNIAALVSLLTLGSAAQAAVVINIDQVGTDVIASGSGTLNTTNLDSAGAAADFGQVNGSTGVLLFAPPGPVLNQSSLYKRFAGASGPATFGSGSTFFASTASGNNFGIDAFGLLYAPISYVSGGLLSGTETFSNTNFATLGITPGTYVYTFGGGVTLDSLTVQINTPTAAVPEPSTWAMLLIGFAGIGLTAYRRRPITARTRSRLRTS